jgi:alkylation response protein AidB-like acyl-CoA dehydrogenase
VLVAEVDGCLDPDELGRRLTAWLDEERDRWGDPGHLPTYAARLEAARDVQRALFDAGWARHGWPVEIGALGGDIRHRAVMYDVLARAGLGDRAALEHQEILLPVVARHAVGNGLHETMRRFLRGDELWAQGFSEPDAGSDLASLRTRARADGDGYRITGHKIWTSWATFADHGVVLARTGTAAERHRGLSVFLVPFDAPGVERVAIRQANGHEELAEVWFEDVWVPSTARIGAEGAGWDVTMEILAYERGASSWLRQALLHARADALLPKIEPHDLRACGDVILDLGALRATAARAVGHVAEGLVDAPGAAPVKVLRTYAEQHLYELADVVLHGALGSGALDDELLARWQEEFLFSRAVSIYGGTEQIQYTTIARFLVGATSEARPHTRAFEPYTSAAEAVLQQSPAGIDALRALEWEPAADHADADLRTLLGALFLAHGAVLASTPSLGALAAAELTRGKFITDVTWWAGTAIEDRGETLLVRGPGGISEATTVVVDVPGVGLHVAAGFEPIVPSVPSLDRTAVGWARVDRAALERFADAGAADLRRRAALGTVRFAAAAEILGAVEAVLVLATEHARSREQFGVSLGTFQAVQHLLARAWVQAAALRDVLERSVPVDDGEQEREGRLVKALAGRNARTILQSTLQVLGAVGFVEDFPHHRYARRVLALDALYGTAAELQVEVARAAMEEGRVWQVPCPGVGSR